ncbi:MAG: hypothetical protein ABH828_00320 [archaeon]
MGIVKPILCVAYTAIVAFGGYSLGTDSDYRVNTVGPNSAVLEDKTQKKSYALQRVNGETIIADFDNNVFAIQYMAKQEMSSGVKSLKDVSGTLDNMVDDIKEKTVGIVNTIKDKVK